MIYRINESVITRNIKYYGQEIQNAVYRKNVLNLSRSAPKHLNNCIQ